MARDKIKQRAANLKAVKRYRKTKKGRELNRRLCRNYYWSSNGDKQRLRGLALKIEVFSKYSKGTPKCACCSERQIGFLTIDHIKGGGSQHRQEIGGGVVFYRWLKNQGYPKGYRILCFNCNCASHIFGVCPHKFAS